MSFSDWTPIRHGTEPAFLTIVAVEYADGHADAYLLPLTLVGQDRVDRVLKESAGAVLARITGARKGAIVDGLIDDETCSEILRLITEPRETATARGRVMGTILRQDALERRPSIAWTRPAGDQSNTLAFADGRVVLKLFRRIEPGLNPEYEFGRFLSEHAFSRAPALVGALEYHRAGLEPGTLAVAQAAVVHQGSGWEFSVNELRRFFERVAPRGAAPAADRAHPAPPPQLEHWYLLTASTLGRRTAELHLTLAHSKDPAFVPEPFTPGALDDVADRMHAHAHRSLTLLGQRLPTLTDAARAQADVVLASAGAIDAAFDRMRGLRGAGMRIRVHGDYHLGQVLRTEEDFVILDFEGEPIRSIAERRAKQSPMKDVAGMVRSYSYAAYAALFSFTTHTPDLYPTLEGWADLWQSRAADAFLDGYAATMGGAAIVPHADAWTRMLCAFMLDKALYELEYELNHRPDWVLIPLMGVRNLVAGHLQRWARSLEVSGKTD